MNYLHCGKPKMFFKSLNAFSDIGRCSAIVSKIVFTNVLLLLNFHIHQPQSRKKILTLKYKLFKQSKIFFMIWWGIVSLGEVDRIAFNNV